MNIEKRATNKVGLIILIIVVLVGVIGGGIYLFTHKDKLNIDWNINLPWDKESDEEVKDVANGKGTTSKKSKNENTTFTVPLALSSIGMQYGEYCMITYGDIEDTEKEVILNYSVEGAITLNRNKRPNGCTVAIERYLVDGYEISGSASVTVAPGETKNSQIKLSKAELESQELVGMDTLQLYITNTNESGESPIPFVSTIKFDSNRVIRNEKSGITVDVLDDTSIQYYKTTVDAVNTYVYFIADNQSGHEAHLKIRKFIVDDKVLDTKDFSLTVGRKGKRLFYITIPKTSFSNVKKFTVSFINITQDPKSGSTSYLISNEYSRKY